MCLKSIKYSFRFYKHRHDDWRLREKKGLFGLTAEWKDVIRVLEEIAIFFFITTARAAARSLPIEISTRKRTLWYNGGFLLRLCRFQFNSVFYGSQSCTMLISYCYVPKLIFLPLRKEKNVTQILLTFPPSLQAFLIDSNFSSFPFHSIVLKYGKLFLYYSTP